MRIAIVASEAAPFAKTGGLADVVGALPKALFRLGHQPILILPLYRAVRRAHTSLTEVGQIEVPLRGRLVRGTVRQVQIPGTDAPAYFLEHDRYFDRGALYGQDDQDYPDNCERFAFLARGALETLRLLGFQPDVIHAHDWQAALLAPYRHILYRDDPVVGKAGVLLTIHNMAYQGVFPAREMETIGLDRAFFNWKQFEYWGKLNLLKGGIVFADALNTVSPTYAREIKTPEFGHGLDGVLLERDDVLHGVVNGIDDAVWNPAADEHLTRTYGSEDLSGKASCKRSLQHQCKLPQRKVPLLGMVSRLADQKGLDLVAKALPGLFDTEPLQCVILGDGDNGIRELLNALSRRYPKQLRVLARHDEHLAHRIIAGVDMVLVPSRFEPCGLTQLYALKYGSIPIVRETGGLTDTVCDCTPATLAAGRATGFTFRQPTAEALAHGIRRAVALQHDTRSWSRLMAIGMSQDWSWEQSAQRYLKLYAQAKGLTQRRKDAKAKKNGDVNEERKRCSKRDR